MRLIVARNLANFWQAVPYVFAHLSEIAALFTNHSSHHVAPASWKVLTIS
jgi:hypothetical protein